MSSLFSSEKPDLVFLLASFVCQGLEMDGASTHRNCAQRSHRLVLGVLAHQGGRRPWGRQ